MMLDPLSTVLDRLRGQGLDPRQAGTGYSCRCPAHEDRSPSLSIGLGDDGRVLVHCQAGCPLDAVLDALGLERRDLFADDGAGSVPRSSLRSATRSPPRPAARAAINRPTFPTAEAAVADLSRRRGAPAGQWEYHDADGRLVGLVLRFNTDTGKSFLPVSRTGADSWVCEGMPAPRPLYNLPAVLAADGPIYVAEGEKAADALVSLGLVATTSPNGSKSAGKADWSPLRGRRVVIVPDRDEPGERYADDVADLAREAGAESVVVVRLADHWPDLPDGGDAHDWIEHHDAAEPADLRHAIEALVAKAEQEVAAVADDLGDEDDDDAVLAWENFPTAALPPPLDRFVRESARGIGSAAVETQVALPLLAALAGAIGQTRAVWCQAFPKWIEAPVIWTAVVAGSGGAKSPAFGAALQFTHEEDEAADLVHQAAMVEHEAAMVEYEAAISAWKLETRKGRGGPAPDKPVRPAARRILTNNVTVESLASILSENPKGILVACEELRGWAASFDCYKSSGRGGADLTAWLQMHDSKPLSTDRKGSGRTRVKRAGVSLTGGIQPSIFALTMRQDDIDSGLLGRLLVAMPPEEEMKWPDGPADWSLEESVRSIFRTLYAIPMPQDGPKVLDLDFDALERFKSFWQAQQEERRLASGAVKGMLSKMNGAVLRLALVIHVVRQAAGETLPDRIDVATIENAIALGRWFAREGRRVYGMLLGGRVVDQAADDAAAAEKWIEARGGACTVRVLRRGPSRFRDDADRAEQAVRRLVAEGRAVRESPPTGGRPADGIRLVGRATKAP